MREPHKSPLNREVLPMITEGITITFNHLHNDRSTKDFDRKSYGGNVPRRKRRNPSRDRKLLRARRINAGCMTNKEILEAAIKKAHYSGWINPELNIFFKFIARIGHPVDDFVCDVYDYDKVVKTYGSVESIIFSHDFAKAFWGDDFIDTNTDIPFIDTEEVSWKYHLQQMVLEGDPISYLAQFLNE